MLLPLALLGATAHPLDSGFEAFDCLTEQRDALVGALEEIRAEHRTEVEARGFAPAWRRLDRRLRHASVDGRTLVETWLDSQPLAESRFFCEDDLPLPTSGLTAGTFVDAAMDHLGGAWSLEEHRLRGPDADREAAAARLETARAAVLHRFDAMYDNRSVQVASVRAELVALLVGFYDERIEPWQLGLDANGTLVAFERDPAEVGVAAPDVTSIPILGEVILWVREITPKPPDMSPPKPFADLDYEPGPRVPRVPDSGLQRGDARGRVSTLPQVTMGTDTLAEAGGSIANEQDAIEAARVQLSWARQREAVRRALAEERRAQRRVRRELRRDDLSQEELDRLARDAERSRRALSRLSEDATRLMVRVQEPQATRPGAETILRGQAKLDEVEALTVEDVGAVEAYREAEELVARAIERGAEAPGTGGGGSGVGGAGGSDVAGSAAGGSEASAGALSEPVAGERPDGRVLAWEGPLPLPDPGWSDGIIEAMRSAHPSLDEVDVRVLLGLLQRALGAEGDRGRVEAAVQESLARGGRLRLRGGEETLSALIDPQLGPDEQVEVVFVLELD